MEKTVKEAQRNEPQAIACNAVRCDRRVKATYDVRERRAEV